MLFVQGNEMKAGTKHAVYRHYNTNEGMFNADEIKKVHETLLLGKHSGKDGKIEYVYTDNNNGVEYTIAAEKKGGKERFVSFYTNRKAPTSNLQNTQLSAQADKDAFNSAKVEENAENSNSASENVRYSKREPLQRREGESIFAYADRVVDEDAARINRANGVDFSKREEADIDRSQREGDDSATKPERKKATLNETKEIWNDQNLSLQERITAAMAKLAAKHQDDKTIRNDAMQAIGGNIASLRKAMATQRKFDQSTVKRVADLAQILITSGHLSGLTAQEVKRLLAVTKGSVRPQTCIVRFNIIQIIGIQQKKKD